MTKTWRQWVKSAKTILWGPPSTSMQATRTGAMKNGVYDTLRATFRKNLHWLTFKNTKQKLPTLPPPTIYLSTGSTKKTTKQPSLVNESCIAFTEDAATSTRVEESIKLMGSNAAQPEDQAKKQVISEPMSETHEKTNEKTVEYLTVQKPEQEHEHETMSKSRSEDNTTTQMTMTNAVSATTVNSSALDQGSKPQEQNNDNYPLRLRDGILSRSLYYKHLCTKR